MQTPAKNYNASLHIEGRYQIIKISYFGYSVYPRLLLRTPTHLFGYIPGHTAYINRVCGSEYCEPTLVVWEIIETKEVNNIEYFTLQRKNCYSYGKSNKEQIFREVENNYDIALPRTAKAVVKKAKLPSKFILCLYGDCSVLFAGEIVRNDDYYMWVREYGVGNNGEIIQNRCSEKRVIAKPSDKVFYIKDKQTLESIYKKLLYLQSCIDKKKRKLNTEVEHKLIEYSKKVTNKLLPDIMLELGKNTMEEL